MLDLIQRRFAYGQLWPLRPGYSQNCARSYIYAISNFPHLIQFHSSKEGANHTVQYQPGSNLDGLVRFWPKASGPEASWCAWLTGLGSGRMQPGCYPFPTFRFISILPQMAQIILCETSPDPVWFRLTVSDFGQMDPVRKQAGVQESLPRSYCVKPAQIQFDSG